MHKESKRLRPWKYLVLLVGLDLLTLSLLPFLARTAAIIQSATISLTVGKSYLP